MLINAWTNGNETSQHIFALDLINSQTEFWVTCATAVVKDSSLQT